MHSHLYYLELVGPLWHLKEESQEYLRTRKSTSDITRLKAEFYVNPSKENEAKLRQLGEDHELSYARLSMIATIGRVRLLQADDAPPNSREQAVAREQAMKILNELVESGRFSHPDYFWAESIKQVWEEEWGLASPSE